MFITKKHLSRRHFITGMGATVSLPVSGGDGSRANTVESNRGHTSKSSGLSRNGSRKRRQHSGRCR